MSEATKTTSSTQPQVESTDYAAQLAAVPMFVQASTADRARLVRDMAGLLADGMPEAEYLEALAEWGGTAAEYLAENGVEEEQEPAPATPVPEPVAPPAEPTPAFTLAQANATLARFGMACKHATEQNYHLGALAAQYVAEFLGAAPGKAKRETAVERLAGEWLLWDAESMAVPQATALKALRHRVNLLLRCHAVATLLGDGRGVAKGDGTKKGRAKKSAADPIPWGKLRELAPLVERQTDDYTEVWTVLPAVADKALALVAEVAASGMDRKDLVAAVSKLTDEDRAARAAQAKAAADKAEQERKARAAEAEASKQAVFAAAEVAKQAEQAVEQATPEQQSALTAAMEQARAVLLARQQADETARLAAEQAAAAKARADKEAADAARKQAEAEAARKAKADKDAKATGSATPAPTTTTKPPCNQGQNVLATLAGMKTSTSKDMADMLATAVMGHEDPIAVACDLVHALLGMAGKQKAAEYGADDMLDAVLSGAEGHGELSKRSQRAVKAALVVLAGKDGPSPAEVATALTPASNGPVATSAA